MFLYWWWKNGEFKQRLACTFLHRKYPKHVHDEGGLIIETCSCGLEWLVWP